MNEHGRSTQERFAVRSGAGDVNGPEVRHSGTETTRDFILGESDVMQNAFGVLAGVMSWWDPLAEDSTPVPSTAPATPLRSCARSWPEVLRASVTSTNGTYNSATYGVMGR